jgi:ADP-dependent NAD(P)H-hydrate dehydratase
MPAANAWVDLNARMLRGWPLPPIAPDADKEERGRVLVVAGSREIAGAAVLAGTAALRAGAGKLVIATAQSVAAHVAIAVPEARVIALPETRDGSFRLDGVSLLASSARSVSAALVGPGLMDEIGSSAFVAALLPMLAHVPVVLDALAMNAALDGKRFEQPVLLTPHAGEMAHLRRCGKDDVESDAPAAAAAGARAWNAVVALKGAQTLIATPRGERWRHAGGHPGLATSGSGDVLAGLITGIAARGAPLAQACAWGVVMHALAGRQLAREQGPVGYLARELADTVPRLLKKLSRASSRGS